MTKEDKCSVSEGKFVIPCSVMQEVVEYNHPTGKQKGVFAWRYTNLGTPTRTFFGAKSGDHVKSGMLFNFCPFCGEKIDAPFAGSEEDDDKGEQK